MDSPKQQIVEKLQAANNILVTVSSNPSVDQLSACIGLTLLLNKLDKHATAVFSGAIPSTMEFLKPEDTIEKNTDSLRDFIIALDKTKADKLRYKVEDKVVKIFITPYRTSLSSDDLDFSQGDFNVDVVLALGVHNQTDLDEAITSHGRILHDATVMCINTATGGELGSLNWVEPNASSLSELASELATSFDKPLLDEQIATALLTGIVAETDRFRNEKTSATTMSVSADLMKAGANQQLVAQQLDNEVVLRGDAKSTGDNSPKDQPQSGGKSDDNKPKNDKPEDKKPDDGTLEISHAAAPEHDDEPPMELPSVDPSVTDVPEESDEKPEEHDNKRALVTEPPTFGGQLTANSTAEDSGLTNVNTLSGSTRDHQSDGPSFDAPRPSLEPVHQSKPEPSPLFAPPEPTVLVEKPAVPQQPPAPPIWQPPNMSSPPKPEPSLPPMSFNPAPPVQTPPPPHVPPEPPKPFVSPTTVAPHETLTELEEAVESSHVDHAAESAADLEKAREEVVRALNEHPAGNLPPVEALNAHSVDLGHAAPQTHPPTPPMPPATQPFAPLPPQAPEQPPLSASPADRPLDMPLPPSISVPPPQVQPPTNSPAGSPNAPPPVPPPMVPPHFGN